MDPSTRHTSYQLLRFCLVTTVVSASFWAVGAVAQAEPLLDGLPLSAGMFVAPAVGV